LLELDPESLDVLEPVTELPSVEEESLEDVPESDLVDLVANVRESANLSSLINVRGFCGAAIVIGRIEVREIVVSVERVVILFAN